MSNSSRKNSPQHNLKALKRQSRAASRRQEDMTELADSLPGAVFQMVSDTQNQLRYSFVSRRAIDVLGTSHEDILNDPLIPARLVLEEDSAKLFSAYEAAAKTLKPFSVDVRIQRPDGQQRWVRTYAAPRARETEFVWNGYWDDVTDELMSEARIQASEARLMEIAAGLPGAAYQILIASDGTASLTYVSEGIEQLVGINRSAAEADLPGLMALVLPEDLPIVESAMKEVATGKKTMHLDYRVRHARSGEILWLRSNVAAIRRDDGTTVCHGFWQNMTDLQSLQRETQAARRRAESAEQRLRAIFDYNHIGLVMIDEDRQFADANPSLRKFLKIEDEQEFARDFPAFSPALQPDGRASVPTAMAMIDKAFSEGYARFDWMHQTRDGEPRPCEVALTRVELDGKPQIFATMTDMRDRAEQEARLRRAMAETKSAQERLSAIFNNISLGVVMVNPEGVFSDPNPTLGQLLEMTPDDDFSEDFMAFSPEFQPDGRRSSEKAPEMIHRAFAEGFHRFYWMHQTRSGDPRPFEIAVTRVELDGKPIAFASMTDLRERERHEAELKVASERAQAASRAKSDFLANMSHEIRTPMNAIVGLSHLGMTSDDPARMRGYLAKIDNASKSLLQIINDILDFSKIEAGKLVLEDASFNLFSVLDNLSDMINMRAAEKGIELLFDVQPGLCSQLRGDSLRLGQILLNLTGNAIKFTEKGQVVVGASMLKQGRDFSRLRFEVRDTGIGLSPEQVTRLFESFTQADTSTTREYGGTGLGLVISQRLVDLMDGQIEVSSELGKGSSFSFTARFGLAQETAAAQESPVGLRGSRVLVVDDNPTSVSILRAHLESFGFEVSTVASGSQAIAAVEGAGQQHFRLVLMDWQMPGMNGIDAALRIRQKSSPEPMLIIMVTAYGREEIERQAKLAGLDGFLIKPVNPSVLLDTIVSAVGADAVKRNASIVPPVTPSESLQGRRVLLVEDNEINQEVALELLEREGLDVELAENGADAVAMVEAADFDVVLMDVQMPVMDGLEACKRIRALNSPRATVPIVAMTANAMDEDRQRCLSAGMNDHLGKPVDVLLLREILHRWLDHSARHKSNDAAIPEKHDGAAPLDFDFEEAVRKMADQRSMWLRVVDRYLKTQSTHDDVLDLLAAGERESATRKAHTLKGVAATLGLLRLKSAASILEQALQTGAPDVSAEIEAVRLAEEAARLELRQHLC